MTGEEWIIIGKTCFSLTDILEKIVGPLNFVPVEEVGLTELEVLQVVMLDEWLPRDIESREQPAPARALLVGDGLHLVHLVAVHVNILLKAPRDNR